MIYHWGGTETVRNWQIRTGELPDMDKIDALKPSLPVSGPIFVDCEKWDHRKDGNSPDLINSVIQRFALPSQIGIYGSPVTETWQGVSRSIDADDVDDQTVKKRIAKWRWWSDVINLDCVGVWCPDLYPRHADVAKWLKSADLMLSECSRLFAHAAKPVIPFVAYRVAGSGDLIELSYWKMIVRWLSASVSSCVLYEPEKPQSPRHVVALEEGF